MIRLAAILRGRRHRRAPTPAPKPQVTLRRVTRPSGASDWTPGGGRLWAPTAPPNLVLGEHETYGRLYPLYYTATIAVSFGPDARSRPVPLHGRAVHVDTRARLVSSYPHDYDEPIFEEYLDSEHPVRSYAWGLVFAREVADGVHHALSLIGDAPVGTRIALASEGRRFGRRDAPGPNHLAAALATYGGQVVEHVHGLPLTVLLESPPGGCPWPGDAGRFYGEQGLVAPDGFVGVEGQAYRPGTVAVRRTAAG